MVRCLKLKNKRVILVLQNLRDQPSKIKKNAGPLGRYGTSKTCRNSKYFHYFVNSTDRSQVIPLITDFFLISTNIWEVPEEFRFSSWFYDVHVQLSTLFTPIFTAAGKRMLLASCPVPLLFKPKVILALHETSGSYWYLQCVCCQAYFACFCHKEDMQISKIPELFFSPILPFVSWLGLTGTWVEWNKFTM